jgi:hypothetical protein
MFAFLAGRTFEPEDISVMSAAFADTCKALGLSEAGHPLRPLVAQQLWDWASEASKPGVLAVTVKRASLAAPGQPVNPLEVLVDAWAS